MTDELEEYQKRLVPASDEEIVALAERMWAEPELRSAFERVGNHGELTTDEAAKVSAVIEAYRQGELWNRDAYHLALAACLLRQVAAGSFESLRSKDVGAFLADRKVSRIGPMIKPVKPSVQEVLEFAKALDADSSSRSVILQLKDFPDSLVREVDKEGVLAQFETSYRHKYGLMNRSGLSAAVGLLRGLYSGSFKSLDSSAVIEALRQSHVVSD
ncbi:hypothetical protein [Pelagibius sp. 7325]|uniref:hypothetical protein n=1 Tax=Pelagibius sp. 7325 TaxID=3131994 RepID=UPI0030EF73D3